MLNAEKLFSILPNKVANQLDAYLEMLSLLREIKDPRVLRSLGPSGVRGLLLKRGKRGTPTEFQASHRAFFDWRYPQDHPDMAELYSRAKQGQWARCYLSGLGHRRRPAQS